MRHVILDTSVVVGSIDERDVHAARAVGLLRALHEADRLGLASLVLLDCVVVETVGVLCRRRAERSSGAPLPDFGALWPANQLTRAYPLLVDAWDDILGLVRTSDGRLNAHDALILTYARRYAIPLIATFDADLGEHGVARLDDAADVRSTFGLGDGGG